jgi:hypothetical protein
VRPPDRLRSMVAAVARSAATFGTDPDRPLHQGRYQSPLRDERLAAWLGAALGVLFTICFVTGLFSHAHQHPLRWFPVPARPAGLYRVTQGLHVAAGIASVPVLLAKLWLVWPRLLSVPPVRRPSDVVERVGLLALVGGGIFMVWTGVANIAQWYPWRFSFTAAHYQVAWITVGGIVAHVGAKWAVARRALAPRWLGRPSRRPRLAEADPVLGTSGEEAHAGLTRRGFLATVAGAGGVLTAVTIGQTVRPLAPLGLLAPRDPRHQPVNRSAANAGVLGAATSPAYRLEITGGLRCRSRSTRCGRCPPPKRSCPSPASKAGATPPAGRVSPSPSSSAGPVHRRARRCRSSPSRRTAPTGCRTSTAVRPPTGTRCWPPISTARCFRPTTAIPSG